MEDKRACFELHLGKQLVVVQARFPRDLFLLENGRFVVVRYCWVVDRRSCGDMESQVYFGSQLILARRPHEDDGIVIAVFLIVRSKEEDGGDNGLDLDEVGVGWLAVFDLEVLSSCLEERGKFFGRHGVRSGLSAWSWSPIWPVGVFMSGLSSFVGGLSAEVDN